MVQKVPIDQWKEDMALLASKVSDADSREVSLTRSSVSGDLFMLPRVCVVILNWCDKNATIACLESLTSVVLSRLCCVVVCDNDSRDGSIEAIETWAGDQPFPAYPAGPGVAPALTVIQTGKNGGYAYGNNRGIQFALKFCQFEYLWILNNDTLIETGSLEALIDYAEREPDAGVIGSTIVEMDNPDIVQCAGGCRYYPALSMHQLVAKGKRRQELAGQVERYRPEIDYISGAAFFMRIGLIRQIGCLCEDFFLYFEELDFTRRMKSTGYTCHWCPASFVRHASRIPALGDSSPVRQYHAQLSALIFAAKWHPYYLPLILFLRAAVKPLMMLAKGQGWLLPHGYRGMRDYFLNGARRIAATRC